MIKVVKLALTISPRVVFFRRDAVDVECRATDLPDVSGRGPAGAPGPVEPRARPQAPDPAGSAGIGARSPQNLEDQQAKIASS